MDIIIAIIFGVVQGLTEFIPVSSSGHLLLLHEFLPDIGFSDALAFDVSLHVGTLIALCIFFWHDCIRYLKAFFSRGFWGATPTDDQVLSRLILIAIIPAGVIGFTFEDIFETVFRSPYVVVVMLIVVSALFFIAEKKYASASAQDLQHLTWKKALLVGSMQVLALIPGTSRSGITIVGGMFAGLTRESAARFSFLIAIPLVFAAGLKKSIDFIIIGLQPNEVPLLIVGVLSSAIVGYVAIRFLLNYLAKHTLQLFALYRLALACIVLLILGI